MPCFLQGFFLPHPPAPSPEKGEGVSMTSKKSKFSSYANKCISQSLPPKDQIPQNKTFKSELPVNRYPVTQV